MEFDSIYHDLAAPAPDPIHVPEPYPTVIWSNVRLKPALPNPKLYPVYGCSPDPAFYERKPKEVWSPGGPDYSLFESQNPFGTLPGYHTSLGVVDVPATPVGGYVYQPESGWVLHATQGGTGREGPLTS